VAASALLLGMDPINFLSKNREDYLIQIGILKKAVEIQAEEEMAKIKAMGEVIASRIAQFLFG
jgi:hypothetical protein